MRTEDTKVSNRAKSAKLYARKKPHTNVGSMVEVDKMIEMSKLYEHERDQLSYILTTPSPLNELSSHCHSKDRLDNT